MVWKLSYTIDILVASQQLTVDEQLLHDMVGQSFYTGPSSIESFIDNVVDN